MGEDELTANEGLILVDKVWIPLDIVDIGALVSLNTTLTVVVDGAILPDMAIFDDENLFVLITGLELWKKEL